MVNGPSCYGLHLMHRTVGPTGYIGALTLTLTISPVAQQSDALLSVTIVLSCNTLLYLLPLLSLLTLAQVTIIAFCED